MAYQLALKTLSLIESSMEADQGAAFRVAQGQVMPHMGDAFRGADEGFRSHLGASMIGRECAREIWYGFHWSKKPKFTGRMLRLFNRGHLEEARFIAALLSIGVQVYQQDASGNQFRISDCGGHFGGSGDGVGIGVPDVPVGTPCLLEFKTHGENSFLKLQKSGVQVAKPEHYAQMNTYMRKMGLMYALYGAVNKNTDEYHMEIVILDTLLADQYLDRAKQIIYLREAPAKIRGASPGLYACRYCDMKDICHNDAPKAVNCRTCFHAYAAEDGTWRCKSARRAFTQPDPTNDILTKEMQLAACQEYTPF